MAGVLQSLSLHSPVFGLDRGGSHLALALLLFTGGPMAFVGDFELGSNAAGLLRLLNIQGAEKSSAASYMAAQARFCISHNAQLLRLQKFVARPSSPDKPLLG